MSLGFFIRPTARALQVNCRLSTTAATTSSRLCWRREAVSRITVRAFFQKSKPPPFETTEQISAPSHHHAATSSSSTTQHFSTQAERMHQLGISTNGQIRPSERQQQQQPPPPRSNGHTAAGPTTAVNQQRRRRRQKMPPRRTDHTRTAAAASSSSSGALYPIKAMHIAQTIDLDKVMQTVLHDNTEKRKLFGKNTLVVELETPDTTNHDTLTEEEEPPRFVSVFRYGAVVFLNVPDKDAAAFLEQIRRLSTDRVEAGNERREHFGIMVQPSSPPPPISAEEQRDLASSSSFTSSSTVNDHYHGSSHGGTTTTTTYHHNDPMAAAVTTTPPPPHHIVTGDYCVVQEIDLNGAAVICSILAQTVALDSYNDTVDKLLHQFAGINSAVRRSGHFRKEDKNFLFKTVAVNNAIFIDMISKIRLKDRSDTAWTMTKYETLHYGLKAEFEIDDRFDQIEFKLNLIQQNAKFFLEVLQHQKSNSLEWIIVWLIALESALMCIDMSGKGEVFFQSLGLL